jgi:hypothetical protein
MSSALPIQLISVAQDIYLAKPPENVAVEGCPRLVVLFGWIDAQLPHLHKVLIDLSLFSLRSTDFVFLSTSRSITHNSHPRRYFLSDLNCGTGSSPNPSVSPASNLSSLSSLPPTSHSMSYPTAAVPVSRTSSPYVSSLPTLAPVSCSTPPPARSSSNQALSHSSTLSRTLWPV